MAVPEKIKELRSKRSPLVIDKVYHFIFVDDLSTLNNLYRVKSIYSYEEIDNMLQDPVGSLYLAANKSAIYVEQKKMFDFRYQMHYKLQSVYNPEQVFYVPEELIVQTPIANYQEHNKFLLTVEIGLLPDQDDLDSFILKTNKLAQDTLGINPKIVSVAYDKVWLTDEDIELFESNRALVKSTETMEMKYAKLSTDYDNLVKRCKLYEDYIKKQLTP